MLSRKNIYIGITVILSGMLLISCGPSEEELVATHVPPTVTPVPPTATPIPSTITPEPWDAEVHVFYIGLRELPHFNSHVMENLLGGTMVDLLAVTEDREWVQATAYLDGGSSITGWLQVGKLRLNVSLDDLMVDTETVFVPPPTHTPGPTRTPKPTELPLEERYIAYFVEKGFENLNNPNEYVKRAGRGFLFVAITDNEDGHNPQFGFISRINATQEERDLTLAHLDEAASFIDPVDGKNMAYSGMLEITTNTVTIGPDGTWRRMWADGETWAQFIHTSTGQDVYILYVYEEENIIKVFFTYLPEDFVHEN